MIVIVTTICLLLIYVLCLLAVRSSASQTSRLIEGATIKLNGVLRLEQRGNNSYLVIQPGSSYEARFDTNDRRKVNVIGISLAGQWDALRSVVGKKVLVSGKVQLEPYSPYYLNGTLILASSITLSNGLVLMLKQYASHLPPATILGYRAIVTFSPWQWNQFSFRAWDDHEQELPTSLDYLSCRLNGPGDVMNCYCADGFAFTGMATMTKNGFSKLAAPQPDFDFAQFQIGEDVRHPIRKEVQCTRQARRPVE